MCWSTAAAKLLYVRKNLPQCINSLIDSCQQVSSSTSYCSEVVVQLSFNHHSMQQENHIHAQMKREYNKEAVRQQPWKLKDREDAYK